ncbi:MAG: hypothetical protein GEU80_15780 [Dehalococcoidia bacterium]|nr:hypothetical protein [Dehalococcoidia bacterium]
MTCRCARSRGGVARALAHRGPQAFPYPNPVPIRRRSTVRPRGARLAKGLCLRVVEVGEAAEVRDGARVGARAASLVQPWHLGLLGIVALGFLVRWLPMAGSDFPLSDGGLFAQMTEDLRAAGYRLPAVTDYNGAGIPFVYPPLGFYLAALLSELPGVEVTGALRILPLLASTLTVAATFPLAARLLRSRNAALLATLVFALLPWSFNWLIVGGGATRALGLLFAIAALVFVYDTFHRDDRRWAAAPGVLLAAAVLSHMEMGWFAIFSSAVLLLSEPSRLRRNLVLSAGGGLALVALTAPWWAVSLSRHGVEPFLAATDTGGWSPNILVQVFMFRFTGAPLLDVFGVLGLLGAAWCVARRQYLLPMWMVAIILLDPRKAHGLLMLPLAMLAAVALVEVVLPALDRGREATARRGLPRLRSVGGVVLALVVVHGAFGAVTAGSLAPSFAWAYTTPVPAEDRGAMAWVAAHTPEPARFAIVTEALNWGEDRTMEWFPALAQRVSLVTPQGSEWLPDGAYQAAIERYNTLQACRTQDAACLIEWSRAHDAPFTHVYLSSRAVEGDPGSVVARLSDCCAALVASLDGRVDFRLLYEDGPVRVYEYVPGVVPPPPPAVAGR